ncbi:MAG: hypothetical protein Q4F95_09305 [Oscillospiraceae bacterium]|nr:hypothetical protein [Oscillospiraceae bacterium]
MWIDYDYGTNIRNTGSENGYIIKDEEYKSSCRITLEECEKYYAITCGIYGAMVHTVFCGDNYTTVYENMKNDLASFIDKETTYDEEMNFYDTFTSKY